jgi:hypothetical protein
MNERNLFTMAVFEKLALSPSQIEAQKRMGRNIYSEASQMAERTTPGTGPAAVSVARRLRKKERGGRARLIDPKEYKQAMTGFRQYGTIPKGMREQTLGRFLTKGKRPTRRVYRELQDKYGDKLL